MSCRRVRFMQGVVLLLVGLYCVMVYVIVNKLGRNSSFAVTAGSLASRRLVLELNVSQLLIHNSDDLSNEAKHPHDAESAHEHPLNQEGPGSSGEQRPGDVPVLMLRGVSPASGQSPSQSSDGSREGKDNSRSASQGAGEVKGQLTDVMVPLTEATWRGLVKVMKKTEEVMFPYKRARVRRVDCGKLFQGDPAELERASSFEQNSSLSGLSDSAVRSLAASCPALKKSLGFITSPLSQEERDFPIAFSILVFKDAEQVMHLLRAIYRPQNHYCVHVDSKAPDQFRSAMVSLADCFPNVFLTATSVDVRWGTFTVLEPELICMRELWTRKGWRYFINLTGQEFPLRTNLELVRILRAYNGANNLEGTRKRANKDRWEKKSAPPGGIIPTKGSVHVVVNRDFVDFVLHSQAGRDFLQWSRSIKVPDELFFASINHNPHLGIRGVYTGDPETHPTTYPFLTRFKNWGVSPFRYPCASGNRVRMICILSSGDLPLLGSRPELFANKFYARESRVALDCLAETLFNRTWRQFLGQEDFNASYYAGMPFVKNMVIASTFNTTA